MSKWLPILLAALVPTLAVGQINTLPSAPHLLVKGHAEAKVIPDRFTIHLNVDVTDMSPDVARREVETHMQELFKALDANGALKDQTRASSLSIQPQTDYEDGKSVFKGTDVSRSIDATFDSLDKLRAFIAAVPADKEVQIGSVETSRSDIDAIRLKLRKAAIDNSEQAAKKIASAYGLKIIGVYSVSEVAPIFAYGIQAGSWGNGEGGEVMATAALAPPPPAAAPVKVVGPEAALRIGTQRVEQNIYAVYLTASN
ncbi:MAG TPA: SIMPL domain-containing protein [Rhodanobacteraceae bacterium]|nr:SIMPL domain-containing protein [Rhodanobacteraceae bacterium]